ncbi:MAG: hypothetical protein NTX48_16075 [Planctomycetales bacterium]|nr:hypothetical protein [Planctomycetales bacterium]
MSALLQYISKTSRRYRLHSGGGAIILRETGRVSERLKAMVQTARA